MNGQGGAGDLFIAKWRGLVVCVKTLEKGRFEADKQAIFDLQNEISLLSTLRHPNLVLFLGAVLPNEKATAAVEHVPLLIAEFMEGELTSSLLISPC